MICHALAIAPRARPEPKILFADEAIAFLDPLNAKLVMDALKVAINHR